MTEAAWALVGVAIGTLGTGFFNWLLQSKQSIITAPRSLAFSVLAWHRVEPIIRARLDMGKMFNTMY